MSLVLCGFYVAQGSDPVDEVEVTIKTIDDIDRLDMETLQVRIDEYIAENDLNEDELLEVLFRKECLFDGTQVIWNAVYCYVHPMGRLH